MIEGTHTGRVWVEGLELSWDHLTERGARQLEAAGRGWEERPFAWAVESQLGALEAVAVAHARNLDICVLDRARLTAGVEASLAAAGLSMFPGMVRPGVAVPGRVWILTSGSTGTPKLIQHSWETLLTVGAAQAPRRWLLPFQVGTYAWYQLVTPALSASGQELVVPPSGDVREVLSEARRRGANAISSTPTFWRVALMTVPQEELLELRFAQVTLGGEVVDQAILEALKRLFPSARISHIYAATEVGACLVVQDGLQGFSATLLAPTTGNARLKVAHGRLFVRSTRRALNVQADSSGWIDTGDLVEVVGERVLFKGRAGRQLINVGGQKAYPADVESVLLAHPDVRWCQVEARRAPLVGSLVTAKVVAVTGGQDADLERRLTAHCQARLPEYAVPRIYEFLGEIPVAGNLKSAL